MVAAAPAATFVIVTVAVGVTVMTATATAMSVLGCFAIFTAFLAFARVFVLAVLVAVRLLVFLFGCYFLFCVLTFCFVVLIFLVLFRSWA